MKKNARLSLKDIRIDSETLQELNNLIEKVEQTTGLKLSQASVIRASLKHYLELSKAGQIAFGVQTSPDRIKFISESK